MAYIAECLSIAAKKFLAVAVYVFLHGLKKTLHFINRIDLKHANGRKEWIRQG